MNGTIFYRVDYELVGRVIAEKLRRRTERCDFEDGVRVSTPREGGGGATSFSVSERRI